MKENIKKLLENEHISNYKISKGTGMAQTTLSDYATGKSKIGNMKLDHALKLNEFYLKIREELEMKNIQAILDGEFKFNKWSAFKNPSDSFENDLSEFGTFKVYNNFKEYVLDHDYLLEDSEGELIDLEKVIADKKEFDIFTEDYLFENVIAFEDIIKPFVYGEANAPDARFHFELLDDIKGESDLIVFINEVLQDLGDVTHSSGLKGEYEVVEVIQWP